MVPDQGPIDPLVEALTNPSPKPPVQAESSGESKFPLTGTQFWLIGGDSRRYGPTDKEGIFQWFEQGRIGRDMMIVDDLNNQSLAGLAFPFDPPRPEPMDEPPILTDSQDDYERGQFYDGQDMPAGPEQFYLTAKQGEPGRDGFPEYLAAKVMTILTYVIGIIVFPVGMVLFPVSALFVIRAEKAGFTDVAPFKALSISGTILSWLICIFAVIALLS